MKGSWMKRKKSRHTLWQSEHLWVLSALPPQSSGLFGLAQDRAFPGPAGLEWQFPFHVLAFFSWWKEMPPGAVYSLPRVPLFLPKPDYKNRISLLPLHSFHKSNFLSFSNQSVIWGKLVESVGKKIVHLKEGMVLLSLRESQWMCWETGVGGIEGNGHVVLRKRTSRAKLGSRQAGGQVQCCVHSRERGGK